MIKVHVSYDNISWCCINTRPPRPPTVCLLIILPTKEDSSCYTVIRFAFVLLVAKSDRKAHFPFFFYTYAIYS